MNSEDSNELHRLADMLRNIDADLESTSILREALRKAGLALQIAFINGFRLDIEERYEEIGAPLTDVQQEHLRGMGINP